MNELKPTDIIEIIALIRANYDNAYANTDDKQAELLVKFWYDSLKGYDRVTVLEAAKNAVKHCQFAPRLADLIREIDALNSLGKKTDEQLWAELTDVLGRIYQISRYLPYPQYRKWASEKIAEIFDALSEELKLYLVNTSTLIEISELPAENLIYEKNRFLKRVPALRQYTENQQDAQRFLTLCDQHMKKLGNGNK